MQEDIVCPIFSPRYVCTVPTDYNKNNMENPVLISTAPDRERVDTQNIHAFSKHTVTQLFRIPCRVGDVMVEGG